jgi:hypothetical protein
MNTNDLTWKETLILMFSVVESDVAIIVSCTPGFVKFTKVYVSELLIVKSLRSSLGGNKPSKNHVVDPNQPRTRRGPRRKENHEFDVLSDAVISSTKRDEGECSIPLAPASNPLGIVRTVRVSQETRYPGFTPATEVRGPRIQNYPTGVFYYGPGTGAIACPVCLVQLCFLIKPAGRRTLQCFWPWA